jgi:hypothetical protein
MAGYSQRETATATITTTATTATTTKATAATTVICYRFFYPQKYHTINIL